MSNSCSAPIHKFEAQGWIPTTSGCLSFTLLGKSRFPTRSVGHTIGFERNLTGFWFQKRALSDSPLPQPLLRALLKIHSEFAFIGVGRTNTDNELEGDIFVFPVTFGGNASWRLVKRKFHGAVSQGLFLERLLAAEADSSGAFWDEYVEGLRKPLACEALFMCRFKVSRSGIATLSPCDPEFRIGEYLALKMKWLESDELALDEATKKPIVRLRFHYLLTQVFGFLKDNLHIHQHHDDNLESLSALHFTRYADEGCGNEEPCPLVKTAHQLHRLILHYKRATQPTQHARIKGVVAYLRSLLLMIKAEDSCVPVEQRNLDYGLDNVLASVESKLEERRWVEEYKTRWINLVMIPTIGITAITTALVAVFQGQASVRF